MFTELHELQACVAPIPIGFFCEGLAVVPLSPTIDSLIFRSSIDGAERMETKKAGGDDDDNIDNPVCIRQWRGAGVMLDGTAWAEIVYYVTLHVITKDI